MQVVLDSLDLAQAERKLCAHALNQAGTIIEAASLLGITRHALKRRITKHRIAWPPPEGPELRNASPMQAPREFQPRVGSTPSHQDPRLSRPAMRPSPPPMNQGMHPGPGAPMPQHPYDPRNARDNNRVRPAPPAHNMPSMPNMMGRPDLRKFDR